MVNGSADGAGNRVFEGRFTALRCNPVISAVLPAGPRSGAFAIVAALLAAALLCSACAVKFVSDYDPDLDRGVTELHTRLTAFLLRMGETAGTPEGEYSHNKEFYTDTQAAISSLIIRAESSPDNAITVQQLQLLDKTVARLQDLHQRGGRAGLRPALIGPIRAALDEECKAITTFELAKRRGK
jgi:hypothetical protein